MTPYLALSWDADDDDAEACAQRVRVILAARQPDWRLLHEGRGSLIAICSSARAIDVCSGGHPTFIIGDVFPRPEGLPAARLSSADHPFSDLCRRLAADYWGAYIAVQFGGGGDMAVFRDPIGMRDGVGWSAPGVHIFASEVMPWLAAFAPCDLAIDWARLRELLADSATVAETTPLSGIETMPAGSLVDIRQDRKTVRRLWEPRAFYDRRRPRRGDAASLRDVVLRCARAWAQTYPEAMLEISGGFDSAAVAASMTAARSRPFRGVTFFTDHLSGDERRYARDVSVQCSLALDEVFMPVGRLGEADLEGVPAGVRPGLSSATLFHDRLLTQIAAEHGVTALFTGHGGDSVFFQHPTAAIAADPSFPRSDIQAYAALAKWSREPTWTVARHALGLPGRESTGPAENDAIVALPLEGTIRSAPSQWAGDLHGLPPAKCVQITAIATDRSAIGPSWRSRVLTVVHPLLSQPLVEWVLATDTYWLTEGRRDRAMARTAFAHALPASVVERRGKGILAHYFGRCLCASVPFLRKFLLEGLLVRHGVLDAARLEPMLDRDFLMRFDCYAKLRSAIITEHWARAWQQRLETLRPSCSGPPAAMRVSCPAM